MNDLGFHITFRLQDGRVIASSIAERRVAARCVLHEGRNAGLLSFGLADTHGHVRIVCDRRAAGEAIRRTKISLQHALGLGVPFAPAHYEPVRNQAHSGHSFWYALRQEARHGTCLDPAFDGTNLPDLLGLRVIGDYTRDNVRRVLPRVRPAALWGLFGELEETATRWDLLGDATAAAIAAPSLDDASRLSMEARAAAVAVAGSAVGYDELSRLLSCSRRSIATLRSRTPPPSLVAAVHGQLQLRSRLQTRLERVGRRDLTPSVAAGSSRVRIH